MTGRTRKLAVVVAIAIGLGSTGCFETECQHLGASGPLSGKSFFPDSSSGETFQAVVDATVNECVDWVEEKASGHGIGDVRVVLYNGDVHYQAVVGCNNGNCALFPITR